MRLIFALLAFVGASQAIEIPAEYVASVNGAITVIQGDSVLQLDTDGSIRRVLSIHPCDYAMAKNMEKDRLRTANGIVKANYPNIPGPEPCVRRLHVVGSRFRVVYQLLNGDFWMTHWRAFDRFPIFTSGCQMERLIVKGERFTGIKVRRSWYEKFRFDCASGASAEWDAKDKVLRISH